MKIFRLPFDLKITVGGLLWIVLPILSVFTTWRVTSQHILPVAALVGLGLISFVLVMVALQVILSKKGWYWFIGSQYIPPTDVQLNRIRMYLEENISDDNWKITYDGVIITKWRSDLLMAKLAS